MKKEKWSNCKVKTARTSMRKSKSYNRDKKRNEDKSHAMVASNQTNNKKRIDHADAIALFFYMTNV